MDDFDLNEIFAEYFTNEFDDPLNAYTSSMANHNGAVTAVAMTQNDTVPTEGRKLAQTGGLTLPTGGIRTTFHTAAIQKAPLITDGTNPVTKKQKTDEQSQQQHQQLLHVQNPLQQQQQQALAAAHNSAMQAHQQTQNASNMQHPGAAMVQGGMVSLPVGVGIRLGGIGGIAPATAQSATRTSGVPGQFNMWGPGTGGMSEQAVAERRQRNREHAKRSRVRKKFMLESLQEQVREMQKQNQNLRMLVQEHIPEHAMKIIAECCTSSPLFEEMDGIDQTKGANLERADFSLMQSLTMGQQCFVLSDPKLPDNPIVFASPGFYKLTGYTSREVLGRNCRFLQGPGTDAKAVDVIRKAVGTGSDATVCLLNYKADGTPFWNQFFIAALRDSDNCIVNYVSFAFLVFDKRERWKRMLITARPLFLQVGVQTEVEPQAGVSVLEDKVNAILPLQTKDDSSE